MLGVIKNLWHQNGPFLALVFIARNLHCRLYSWLVSRSLPGRPKIRVHPSARVLGSKRMFIGHGFTAERGLWLEAVGTHLGKDHPSRIEIGRNVHVNEDVHIAAAGSVRIGDNVLMASRIYISDHNHGTYSGPVQSDPRVPPNDRPLTEDSPVVIGDGVWIGEMVAILPGATVGDGCIVGSGSVVTGAIPPWSIAVGAPARVVKRYDFQEMKWVKA